MSGIRRPGGGRGRGHGHDPEAGILNGLRPRTEHGTGDRLGHGVLIGPEAALKFGREPA
jgi:hypothetical protein